MAPQQPGPPDSLLPPRQGCIGRWIRRGRDVLEGGGEGLAGPPSSLGSPRPQRQRLRKNFISLNSLASKAWKKILPQTVEGEEGGGEGV